MSVHSENLQKHIENMEYTLPLTSRELNIFETKVSLDRPINYESIKMEHYL